MQEWKYYVLFNLSNHIGPRAEPHDRLHISPLQDLNRYKQLDKDQTAIYCTIIRAIIYLSNITQPDIAYITGQLARIMAKPNRDSLKDRWASFL
jgi:hypothetical protein